jgi:hypothetical protein
MPEQVSETLSHRERESGAWLGFFFPPAELCTLHRLFSAVLHGQCLSNYVCVRYLWNFYFVRIRMAIG